MKLTIKVEKTFDIKKVQVFAGVRYWEDAGLNGESIGNDGDFPFRSGDNWCPVIDIETGIIENWPNGETADVHFKVCDCGTYCLIDENGVVVKSIENDYVPNKLIPGEYGDYIIMKIDEEGKIDGWNPSFEDFEEDED